MTFIIDAILQFRSCDIFELLMLRVKFLLSFCLCSFIAIASDLNKDASNASKETELTKENKERLQNEIQPSKKDTVTQKALEKAKNEEFERKFAERGSLFDAMECSLRNNKEIFAKMEFSILLKNET